MNNPSSGGDRRIVTPRVASLGPARQDRLARIIAGAVEGKALPIEPQHAPERAPSARPFDRALPADAAAHLAAALERIGPADRRPRLAAIDAASLAAQLRAGAVDVALAPGVVLPVRVSAPGHDGRTRAAFADGALNAIAAHARHADVLAGRLAKARLAAAAWATRLRETPGAWVEIVVAPDAHPRAPGAAPLEVRLHRLDDRLSMATAVTRVAGPAQVRGAIGVEVAAQRRRSRRLAAAERHGADGWIDAITFRALDRAGLLPAALERALEGPLMCAPDIVVAWLDGCLHSFGMLNKTGRWVGTAVELPGVTTPETMLGAMAGRPATDILEHGVLDDGMMVRRATASPDGRVTGLQLALPLYAFRAAAGRVWRP